MILKKYLFTLALATSLAGFAQGPHAVEVFKDQPVNFTGEKGDTINTERLQDGRLIFKKVTAPIFKEGTDVKVKMTLRSQGDPWDKSGSLFVITDPKGIDVLDVARGTRKYPDAAGIDGYPGVRKAGDYTPALGVLRFMTPFGAGYFSTEEVAEERKYSRPVYIPK